MAARLTVVLVQSPATTPGGAQLVDDLVGQLIGAAGIDLTLVSHSDRWTEDSTDRMTLETLPAEFAVLDFALPAEMRQTLISAGVDCHRFPHSGDADAPSVPATATRKLYAVDLRQHTTAESVRAVLDGLLKSRQTRTFSLPVPAIAPQSPSSPSSPNAPAVAKTTLPADHLSPSLGSAATEADRIRPRVTRPDPRNESDSESPDDLDGLIDALDEFDT